MSDFDDSPFILREHFDFTMLTRGHAMVAFSVLFGLVLFVPGFQKLRGARTVRLDYSNVGSANGTVNDGFARNLSFGISSLLSVTQTILKVEGQIILENV